MAEHNLPQFRFRELHRLVHPVNRKGAEGVKVPEAVLGHGLGGHEQRLGIAELGQDAVTAGSRSVCLGCHSLQIVCAFLDRLVHSVYRQGPAHYACRTVPSTSSGSGTTSLGAMKLPSSS